MYVRNASLLLNLSLLVQSCLKSKKIKTCIVQFKTVFAMYSQITEAEYTECNFFVYKQAQTIIRGALGENEYCCIAEIINKQHHHKKSRFKNMNIAHGGRQWEALNTATLHRKLTNTAPLQEKLTKHQCHDSSMTYIV